MTRGDGADEASLEKSMVAPEPVDVATAEVMLREAKQIMDRHGVAVFLRQGTCLGAVRDQRIIPWDDDLDLGSILGFHGLTEEAIDPVVASFKDIGYFVRVERGDHSIAASMMRSSIRLDWTCYRVIGGNIFHFPGLMMPVRLFAELKEINFLGERFLVPN
ncbi:MAG: LicD family protein, partial [SAR202 cluster bacterium]|nr:LicD family protein [SAR202 cluster bacterium]